MKKLETIVKELGIEDKDIKIVVKTFQIYEALTKEKNTYTPIYEKKTPYSKEDFKGEYKTNKNIEQNEIIKSLRKTKEIDPKFFNNYGLIYNCNALSEDREKRDIYVNGMKKILDISDSLWNIDSGEYSAVNIWKLIFGLNKNDNFHKEILSSKTLSLWVKSYSHLKQKWKGVSMSKKLGRFSRISRDYLGNFHESYNNILKLLETKGEIFEIEDFMFDLAREQNLNLNSASEYFEVLKSVNINDRPIVEKIRKQAAKDKSEEMNKCIYDLLSLSKKNKSSMSSLVLFFNNIMSLEYKEKKSRYYILNNKSKLIDIIENDRFAIENLAVNTKEILKLEIHRNIPGLLDNYLELVSYTSKLDDKINGDFYRNFLSNLLIEYTTNEKVHSVRKEINNKFINLIEKIKNLKPELKETAIILINSGMKKLQGKISLENLTNSIIKSISLNKVKSRYFIEQVIDYK